MSFTTSLLIAAAAAILLVVYRVGRSSSEAAHAHAADDLVGPGEQDQAALHSRTSAGTADEGTARGRHGCC